MYKLQLDLFTYNKKFVNSKQYFFFETFEYIMWTKRPEQSSTQ